METIHYDKSLVLTHLSRKANVHRSLKDTCKVKMNRKEQMAKVSLMCAHV